MQREGRLKPRQPGNDALKQQLGKKKEETEPNHFPSLCRCIVWGEGGVEGRGGLGLGGVVVGEGIKRLHQRGPQQEMRTPAQAGKLRTINIFMRPCIFHAGV